MILEVSKFQTTKNAPFNDLPPIWKSLGFLKNLQLPWITVSQSIKLKQTGCKQNVKPKPKHRAISQANLYNNSNRHVGSRNLCSCQIVGTSFHRQTLPKDHSIQTQHEFSIKQSWFEIHGERFWDQLSKVNMAYEIQLELPDNSVYILFLSLFASKSLDILGTGERKKVLLFSSLWVGKITEALSKATGSFLSEGIHSPTNSSKVSRIRSL